MNPLEPLLAPISEAEPCGRDISFDPEFLELDQLIQGKAETQFSEAVKPDWKLLYSRCEQLLAASKHIYVATVFVIASLQTGGLTGAANSLDLLARWLRLYWTDLYPRLDPDDNLDPLERMNILSALTCPVGTFGDAFRFIERLAEAPLTNSPVLGKLTYARINGLGFSAEEAGAPPDPGEVSAAFRDTPPEELGASLDAIRRSTASVKEISTFLSELPQSDKAPNFGVLLQQLAALEKEVAPYVVEAAQGSSDAKDPSTPAASGSPRGTVTSRSDVVAALDRICAYYSTYEPSSPIPLLLQRARRLVHLDFLQIMADLAPDAVPQIRSATGSTEKSA